MILFDPKWTNIVTDEDYKREYLGTYIEKTVDGFGKERFTAVKKIRSTEILGWLSGMFRVPKVREWYTNNMEYRESKYGSLMTAIFETSEEAKNAIDDTIEFWKSAAIREKTTVTYEKYP